MDDFAKADAVLLRDFAEDGSQEAFAALVERHRRLVYGVCHRVLGNGADAEEAGQAAFIALALKAKRLDAAAGLGGWLHRVARQVAIDFRKAGLRRRQRDEEAVRRDALRSDSWRPFRDEDGRGDLDEAIAALPGKLKSAIIGHYLEGRSLEELAREGRCGVSAISMRLNRARERLRRRLGSAAGLLIAAGPLAEGEAMGTAAIVRTVGAALKGVAATETAAAALFKIANESLRSLFFAKLRWAAAGGAACLVAAGIAAAVVQTPLAAKSSPPEKAPASDPVASAAGSKMAKVVLPIPDPPLIAAIRNNEYGFDDYPKFKALLDEQGQSLDSIRDAGGKTPLHWTVIRGWNEFSLLLLLRGAGVNAVDAAGYTPLFYAVERGDSWLQKLLLLRGADVNHVAGDGTTPLTHAVAKGAEADAETLLWLGAAPRVPGAPEARQPLALAGERGSPGMVALLNDYREAANPDAKWKPRTVPAFVKNSLHEAARTADFMKLEAFLDAGVNINLPDEKGRTALHRAIGAGQAEVVYYLLTLGADPNVPDRQGVTPLMTTMGWLGGGLDAMRRFLILKGASPFAIRKNGFNELTWAVERDNEHGVQWLLWLGANGREPTSRGTPFQIAFEGGRQRIMNLLRRNGIDEPVKWRDDPVWNFHNAVQRGDNEMILKLLAEGVPVDAPNKKGDSPLIAAISCRNVPTARLLLEHGADLDYRNPKTGATPLGTTVGWDYHEMTEFREDLLKAGADPNAPSGKNGETPLMRAVWHEPTMPLKQLLEYGGDLSVRDSQGLTPLGRALRDGKQKTADYLRELGGTE